MAATPIGRLLRFAAWVLAAALLTAGAGSLTTAARADETPPCDEAAQDAPATEGEASPCAELVPPETTTTTTPAAEPTRATATIPDAVPPKVVEGLTPEAPAEAPKPAPTKPPATEPPATTPTWNSGAGIFDGAMRITLPPHSGTPRLAGGPYVFPVVGESSFTDTWGAARATVAWHHGVDIFAPFGAPIVAVADGTLFSVGWNTIGGRRLWLRDRQGNYFYYAHLSAFAAGAVNGTVVRAGTVIGYVGNTGDAEGTPYHLHFEVHPVSLLSLGYDGAVNPFPYVSTWPRLGESFAARGGSLIAPAAPTPGAILMGFTDISSADGLAPESLDQTLGEPALAAALDAQPEAVVGATLLRTPIVAPRQDGERIARTLDSEASRPARYADSVWDALAECESGGDWSANTGNGFIGGLQFLPQTWLSHGGGTFARSPNLATREEQIAVARRVLETQGWQAWPACSAMLGLRKLER